LCLDHQIIRDQRDWIALRICDWKDGRISHASKIFNSPGEILPAGHHSVIRIPDEFNHGVIRVIELKTIAQHGLGGEAEELRKAMGGKRSEAILAGMTARLREGMTANRFDVKTQETVLEVLSTVKEFMFPESHAHSFASLAYWHVHASPSWGRSRRSHSHFHRQACQQPGRRPLMSNFSEYLEPRPYFQLLHAMFRDNGSDEEIERTNKVMRWVNEVKPTLESVTAPAE
jgi:hypothetical protein